ncbi:MAG: hypothetical protein JWR19_2355 [Pedosphaera sp.]|nr:hypothetical protein [Pedosphaera sp.]
MKVEDLIEHRNKLNAKIEAIEIEKAQLVRKLKAVDILLEGSVPPASDIIDNPSFKENKKWTFNASRKRPVPPHAVRISHRSSLIGAVEEMAKKQPGGFDSVQLLNALQSAYPEFNLKETKHISSPLSDLVDKGVLVVERKRIGAKPNVYRVAEVKH